MACCQHAAHTIRYKGMGRLKKYAFEARLERFPMKGGWYYLLFPYSAQEEFGKKGFIRVKGTINGVPYERSLLPMKNGESFIVVPLKMRKETGLLLGHEATVELQLDERPITFAIPEELEAVFDIEPEVRVIFEKQSKSIQREICKWISDGKREQTRADRAAEILRRLTTPGSMFGGRPVR